MDLSTKTSEMADAVDRAQPVELTAEIVSAYVSNNTVATADLATLIAAVHGSIAKLGTSAPVAEPEPLRPAVPVKKSVTPEYIVCLEDGKKLKMLKRHLSTSYGLTPDAYRKKWGLPADYPMVAPAYAEARSELAKAIGLGRGGKAARAAAQAEAAPAKRRRGPGKKAQAAA